MKKIMILAALWCFLLLTTNVQAQQAYQSLDPADAIVFGGDRIVYRGETIVLDERTFFVDGQLSAEEAARYPYVFNSFGEAVKNLSAGTEAHPMRLYLAPYVYWVDDPDDPGIRKPKAGNRAPFGMEIACSYLHIYGLTGNPENVVLASNRGQTQGAEGNFTMFRFTGDGLRVENLTLGNYCNVDLEFPLLPRLNREKRASAIVQAQLAFCNGDKVLARNCRFISRLNLCPLSGGKRTLFDRCYFECTDDALAGTGVYLDCRFTFYSSKPFYATQGTGAVFLNCDMDVLTRGRQYFTKAGSPVIVVDSRFHSVSDSLYVGWTQDPADDLRCYQFNVSLNGKPLFIGAKHPALTVDMAGKDVLNAYRIVHGGKVVYNTYNLLRGDDDWDPMGVKAIVAAAERETGKNLHDIATWLRIAPAKATIESGVDTVVLNVAEKRFRDYDPQVHGQLVYSTSSRDKVLLEEKEGRACVVTGTNNDDETSTVVVTVRTPAGLESAAVLTVAPRYLEAPQFVSLPEIVAPEKGRLSVRYVLALEGRRDESLVTWYRCADARGAQPVEVSVSRLNRPEMFYELSPADAGYYMMVRVAPKHLRSHPGKEEQYIMPAPISKADVTDQGILYTDFHNFPTANQPLIMPGFWTVDGYKPKGLEAFEWTADPSDCWRYGAGINGCVGTGLLQTKRGARLLYTPLQGDYGDMSVTLNVDPAKTAGQGFGSATGQYMDIYIKFDTKTLTGYALRIIRTVKFDHAVDFILMKYENGEAIEISRPVSSVCYHTDCTITLSVQNNRLTAHAETSTPVVLTLPGLYRTVDLQAEIEPNVFGGTGIQHTGTAGEGVTMLHRLLVEWKQ